LPAIVTIDAASVDEDKDVVVVESVQLDVASHIIAVETEGSAKPAQQIINASSLVVVECFARNDFGLYGSVFKVMFGSSTCYNHFTK
jgi:hypothetical protein